MNRIAAALVATLLGVAPALAGEPAYRITGSLAIGAPDKWDFLFYDNGRVYIAHGTEITVVDVKANAVVGRVTGIDTSHGVLTALGRGYADSSNAKTVTVFDLETLNPVATLAVGEDSDAMTFDAATKRVFVMDADGAAFTAIDAVATRTLATVPLGGKPEMAASDGAGKVYINLASTGELVRVDAATLKIEKRWKLADCTSPHGLSIDASTRRLFVSCENQKMQVVSADDGHVVATVPIGKGTDADAFDPVRKRAFSSNADGTLSVIAENGADSFSELVPVPTAPGARTMTLDPATGRIFVVAGDVAGSEASKEPGRAPRNRWVPGSLKLIWLDPVP